jgi:hypothetical protein
MLRKATCGHRLVTDGWSSRDPADDAIIEAVHKKNLREAEERLMLAGLESAVEDFQNYLLATARMWKETLSTSGGVVFRKR